MENEEPRYQMFTDVFSRFIIRDTAIANSDEDNKNKEGTTKMPLKDKQQMENNPNVYTIFRERSVFFYFWKTQFKIFS